MENASKALIMAGGMLIAVIIMSIGVYLFSVFGGTSKSIQQQVDNRVLAEFNNNFLRYQGSTDCTIHDIVSLASFAQKNNQDFEFTPSDKDNDYYVCVYVKGANGVDKNTDLSSLGEDKYIELLNKNSVKYGTDALGRTTAETQYFTCSDFDIEYSEIEGQKRVKSITFKKNT